MAATLNRWAIPFVRVDELLRAHSNRAIGNAISWQVWPILIAAGCCYGIALGSFGGDELPRIRQMIYSAEKVPVLLTLTFWITLPSVFIVSSLLGLRSDFPDCFKAIVESQAILTIILASLAPFTALWYASVPDYSDAILFNAAMFMVASLAAQAWLRRAARPLVWRRPRIRWMLRLWLIIYAFVGIQMGWALRPFIGTPGLAITFFRSNAFTNAYVVILHLIVRKF